MQSKLFFVFLLCLLFCFRSASSQDIEVDEDYISEFIYGININTYGGLLGGVNIKSSKIARPRQYRTLGLEIVGIKNHKEFRFQNTLGNSFIIGKRNYLYSFRPQYGRDFILFKKASEEGVQVSAVFAGGPSIGLLVPYHILYDYGGFNGLRSEQYDPEIHNLSNIFGSGSFLDGLANSKIILGANVKLGLSLDFSAFGNSVTGVEAGFTFETFSETPEILVNIQSGLPPIQQNRFFSAVYLTLFFGSRR